MQAGEVNPHQRPETGSVRHSMRSFKPLLLPLTWLVACPAFGNGGDGHQFPHIEEQDAVLYGQWFVEQFIGEGEIDASWGSAEISMTAELQELPTGPEWVVTAQNERAAQVQRLYIYFGPMGQYLGWEPHTSDQQGADPHPNN